MGKKTNESRKKLFERLKAEGRLEAPGIVPKQVREEKKREYWKQRRRRQGTGRTGQVVGRQSSPAEAVCCKFRYKDLPDGFKECYGCPCAD